jgi:uncharacterized repeat protein (TIGR01451 family)
MSNSTLKRTVIVCTLLALTLLMASAAYAQASLSVAIQVTPPAEEDAQGRITYAATVTNSGLSAANNVVVTFTMPYTELPISSIPGSCVFTYNGPLFATCPIGSIAGGNGQGTATVVIYPTGVGNLFVTADVIDDAKDTATVQGGSTVTGVGIADVAVFLTATPNPAQVGVPLTYGVTAYNIGDDDARDVVVSVALPPSVKFVSATKQCTHSATLVNCKVGHMVVSGSAAFNITVLPTVSGWTFATALLRAESVADPSTLDNSVGSRIWVNP